MKNSSYSVKNNRIPHRVGFIGMPNHTFEDFDMPRVFGLVEPTNEYGMRFARVYTPNPWNPDEIRFFDWSWSKTNEGWVRTRGGMMSVEEAREDWKTRRNQGHFPRDMIAEPFHGGYEAWDIFAFHFSHTTYGFHEVIRTYGNDYPRKKVG